MKGFEQIPFGKKTAENTPEHRQKSEKESAITEKFLHIPPLLIGKYLDRNPDYFDSLKSEQSAAVLRKLTEVIKYLDEYGNADASDKLKAIKKEIYEQLENPVEPEFLRGFSEIEKQTIAEETEDIELTKGCSVNCRFCGFNADKKITKQIPFADLTYFINHYASSLPKAILPYRASDPLDYEDGDKNYMDFLELCVFNGIKPYTSTAYPKTKTELFKLMLQKKYIDRVSVSNQNFKRLKREGYLSEDSDGYIDTPYDAIKQGLETTYKKVDGDRKEVYIAHKDEDRTAVGRAFDETSKNVFAGGIECEIGTTLTTDGFYNHVTCKPQKDRPTGIISQKIDSEKISKPLSKKECPKTIDELMEYGVVVHEDVIRRSSEEFGFCRIYNFSGDKKQEYFVEYNMVTLAIIDIDEIEKKDEKLLEHYIQAKSMLGVAQPEKEPANVLRDVFYTMPLDLDLKKYQGSIIYEKMTDITRELIEDFITSPFTRLEFNNYLYLIHGDISEGNKNIFREGLSDFVTTLKNAFVMARDGVFKTNPQIVDEMEKKFMDKLHDYFRSQFLSYKGNDRLTQEEKNGSLAFLKKIFNQ